MALGKGRWNWNDAQSTARSADTEGADRRRHKDTPRRSASGQARQERRTNRSRREHAEPDEHAHTQHSTRRHTNAEHTQRNTRHGDDNARDTHEHTRRHHKGGAQRAQETFFMEPEAELESKRSPCRRVASGDTSDTFYANQNCGSRMLGRESQRSCPGPKAQVCFSEPA